MQLPRHILSELARRSLDEDVGYGDVTTLADRTGTDLDAALAVSEVAETHGSAGVLLTADRVALNLPNACRGSQR